MVHLTILQGDAVTDAELAEAEASRPRTRGDCEGGPRPCPRVGCRHHLLIHHDKREHMQFSGLKRTATDDEIVDRLFSMEETCALDVADRYGGMNRADVGRLIGLSRERVRHLERKTPADALISGFESWFGERRDIVGDETTDEPKPERPKSPGRNRWAERYSDDLRAIGLAKYDETGRTRDACNAIFEACGRMPETRLIRSWAERRRLNALAESGEAIRWRVTDRIVQRCAMLRDRGMTYGEIAKSVSPEYGRTPRAETVRLWIKRARGKAQ